MIAAFFIVSYVGMISLAFNISYESYDICKIISFCSGVSVLEELSITEISSMAFSAPILSPLSINIFALLIQ